jgi:hypothetical protein
MSFNEFKINVPNWSESVVQSDFLYLSTQVYESVQWLDAIKCGVASRSTFNVLTLLLNIVKRLRSTETISSPAIDCAKQPEFGGMLHDLCRLVLCDFGSNRLALAWNRPLAPTASCDR